MKICPFIASLLLVIVWSCPVLAQDAAADATLERIQNAAEHVQTIQSEFVQIKKLSVFASELRSRGMMVLEKPDRLRWEYLEPSVSGFIVDGENAIRWSELSPAPERFAIDDDMAAKIVAEQLLAWASVDLERLQGAFEISVEQANPPVLKLTPRSERLAGYLQEITITFSEELSIVHQVRIVERDGDSTLLQFENVVVNEPLPDNIFTY